MKWLIYYMKRYCPFLLNGILDRAVKKAQAQKAAGAIQPVETRTA